MHVRRPGVLISPHVSSGGESRPAAGADAGACQLQGCLYVCRQVEQLSTKQRAALLQVELQVLHHCADQKVASHSFLRVYLRQQTLDENLQKYIGSDSEQVHKTLQ